MAYRIAKVGGMELLVNLDDGFRSSALWQYGLKPVAHAGMRCAAFTRGMTGRLLSRAPSQPSTNGLSHVTPEQQAILDQIAGLQWFHTIDLPHGVSTPGAYDHRPLLHHYPIPERLDGMRVLDAGTLDGFWAFEMERRGAKEVVALDVACIADLDLPPSARKSMDDAILTRRTGATFEVAHRLLNSNVKRHTVNLYELSPERLGKFDFVFCSDLLCLLAKPVQALQNLCSVTSSQAVIVDRYNTFLPKFNLLYHGADEGCLWWSYSLTALEKMIRDAGFSNVEVASTFKFAQRGARAWSSAATFKAKA